MRRAIEVRIRHAFSGFFPGIKVVGGTLGCGFGSRLENLDKLAEFALAGIEDAVDVRQTALSTVDELFSLMKAPSEDR